MTAPPVDRLRELLATSMTEAGCHDALDKAYDADEELKDTMHEWLPALLEQAARTAELEAALRPFAECAAWIAEVMPSIDADYHEVQLGDWPYSLSIGWFRAARKALQERSALDG